VAQRYLTERRVAIGVHVRRTAIRQRRCARIGRKGDAVTRYRVLLVSCTCTTIAGAMVAPATVLLGGTV